MPASPPVAGFVASALCGSLYLYLRSSQRRGEQLATGAVAVLLVAASRSLHADWRSIFTVGSAWALVAFLVTLLAPLFDSTQIASRQRMLWQMCVPILAILASAIGLKLCAMRLPITRDFDLYAADASFGLQPAFFVAQSLAGVPILNSLLAICYESLPLIAVVAYDRLEQRDRDEARRLLLSLALIGVIGFCAYRLVPGAGTVAVFGPLFPGHPPALSAMARIQRPDPSLPRNCFPSLHTAWILAIWWAYPRTRWRWLMGITVAFTLAATMTGGGHYLIDLIVAVPFATGIDCASRHRYGSAAAMGVFTLAWTLAVRHDWLLLMPPAGAWMCAAASTGLCLFLRSQRSSLTASLEGAQFPHEYDLNRRSARSRSADAVCEWSSSRRSETAAETQCASDVSDRESL